MFQILVDGLYSYHFLYQQCSFRERDICFTVKSVGARNDVQQCTKGSIKVSKSEVVFTPEELTQNQNIGSENEIVRVIFFWLCKVTKMTKAHNS